MKKILGLALVVVVSGFHHGRSHHGGFRHFGCCFGTAFVGGVFVGSALAYPYYAYPYEPYPVYADAVYAPVPAYQPQTQVSVAPSIQREVCYPGGCYHLRGDCVTVPYAWIWVPGRAASVSDSFGPLRALWSRRRGEPSFQ